MSLRDRNKPGTGIKEPCWPRRQSIRRKWAVRMDGQVEAGLQED